MEMVCINKAVKPLKKTQFLLWRLHFRTNLSYQLKRVRLRVGEHATS
jgi:hypothetical protein